MYSNRASGRPVRCSLRTSASIACLLPRSHSLQSPHVLLHLSERQNALVYTSTVFDTHRPSDIRCPPSDYSLLTFRLTVRQTPASGKHDTPIENRVACRVELYPFPAELNCGWLLERGDLLRENASRHPYKGQSYAPSPGGADWRRYERLW